MRRSLAAFLILGLLTPSASALGKDPGPKAETAASGLTLYEPGTEPVIDYAKYGTFTGAGTDKYEYKLTDRKGLSAAAGEGIYPNNSVFKDPAYRVLMAKGKLSGTHWDYVNIDDQSLAFYKWASANDTPGVKQYYTALTLEKLGLTRHAINAYYAVAVHFPKNVGWTYFHTPLYMGRLALDRVDYLTRKHPELGMKLVGAKIRVEGGYNSDLSDDKFIVDPGKLIAVKPADVRPKSVNVAKLKVKRTLGGERTKLVQFENGHWQMQVDGKPYMVKAVAYAATPVGRSTHEGYNLDDWMTSDLDKNGRVDGPYDAWVDKNKNNKMDADEKPVGDFALMKAMGVNTIRLYHHPQNKELFRKMFEEYGIRLIVGDLLGMYAVGSGAEWFKGTDYTDPVQQENMKKSVRQMVEEWKDEPYILMWMLGNESNYGSPGTQDTAEKKGSVGFGSQAKLQPDAHYKFVNEVAKMIHEIDPTRPVGFSNGEVITIDILSRYSDNIDVFGVNAYRGKEGFGRSFWEDAHDFMDKPVLLTEYGCPAYHSRKDLDTAEALQKEYHQGNWEDILYNAAGSGFGNAIGGVAFEFVDEWWKAGPPPNFSASVHETHGDFQANFPDGWMYEEWLGLTSQGDGSHSPFMRQTRQAYDYYKKAWNE